jgi:hypothetical protein
MAAKFVMYIYNEDGLTQDVKDDIVTQFNANNDSSSLVITFLDEWTIQFFDSDIVYDIDLEIYVFTKLNLNFDGFNSLNNYEYGSNESKKASIEKFKISNVFHDMIEYMKRVKSSVKNLFSPKKD